MRQLWDWKRSADVEAHGAPGMAIYGRMCGWTLARGHARSGDRVAIARLSRRGATPSTRAIARFAESYADQNELDHRTLQEAVASGRVTAESGV